MTPAHGENARLSARIERRHFARDRLETVVAELFCLTRTARSLAQAAEQLLRILILFFFFMRGNHLAVY
jgi:hypothetical protein